MHSENRGKIGGLHPDGRRINGVDFERKFRKEGRPIYRLRYARREQ
jgi:hypothetical protein